MINCLVRERDGVRFYKLCWLPISHNDETKKTSAAKKDGGASQQPSTSSTSHEEMQLEIGSAVQACRKSK